MNSSKLDVWATLNAVISTGVVVFALVCRDAFAVPIPSTSAFVAEDLNTSLGSKSSSPIPSMNNNGPSTASDAINIPAESGVCPPNSCTVSADGSTSSFADFGLIGALAAGDASASDGATASFNNSAGGSWTDYITPTSATLPNGTKVSANATLTLQGLTDIGAGGTAEFDARLLVNGTLLGVVCVDVLPRSPSGCLEAIPNDLFSTQLLIPVELVIGETTELVGALDVLANGSATTLPDEGATVSVLADGARTSHLFLEPVGDFSLIAASGHDYSPASGPPTGVPEPGSLALLGIGLGALGLSRRRATR